MRSRVLSAVLVAAAVCASVATAQVAPKPASSFVAVVSTPVGSELVAWRAPEDLAVRPLSGEPTIGSRWVRAGRIVYRFAPGSPVSVFTRTFAAQPDAPPLLDPLRGPTDFVLARARAGRLKLKPGPGGARRVRIFAPPNECAGLRSGSIELWFRRADFLPLRLLERHGQVVNRDIRIEYRSVGKAIPSRTFAPPPMGRPAYREDMGFVRSTPAAAAARLSYTPELPRALPRGFRLAVSGWARQSGTTGPEGSIPPAGELFAAVYRRGTEEIHVTQRLSPPGGWANDPFGAECVRQFRSTVAIGRARAAYGDGPYTTPHLYWRSGRVLHTVSGPFPRARLAAIARSLRPVS